MGDGSYTPSAIYRPWVPIIGRNRIGSSPVDKPTKKAFVNPLRLFTYPDVLLLLFYNGILYAVLYGVTATTSTLFQKTYPFLSETDIGLCYLAIGGGMVFGSVFSGRFLDRDYQSIKKQMIRKAEADREKSMRLEDVMREENFPIEHARLRTTPIYLALFVSATLGYGWCLQKSVNLAVPLILQIISELQAVLSEYIVEARDSSGLSNCCVYERHTDTACRPRPVSGFIHHSLCKSSTYHLSVPQLYLNRVTEQSCALFFGSGSCRGHKCYPRRIKPGLDIFSAWWNMCLDGAIDIFRNVVRSSVQGET